MNTAPKILAFAGSVRTGSYNQMLVDLCATSLRAKGAEVTVLSLKDYPMPFFDEDLEKAEGLPKAALALKELIASHHGLLIASPEYNTGMPPILKNCLDWASRPVAGEGPLASYKHKVSAIMSASVGAWGGVRNLPTLRTMLSYFGMTVIPNQLAIGTAQNNITPTGLTVEREQKMCDAMLQTLVDTCRRLAF